MARFTFDTQPPFRLLSDSQVETIHQTALEVLEQTGVTFDCPEALEILAEHGGRVDFQRGLAKLPPEMVVKAIEQTPETVRLYDREGNPAADLAGNQVYFDPGSACIRFMESDGKTVRESRAEDLRKISLVNDAMHNIKLQSTAVVANDVPKVIADSYRLYILLQTSPKAIITGAFSVHGVDDMRDLLAVAVGGYEELAARPRAVFDICPSPPLKWTNISSHNIIDCARYLLPIETVSMPMPGAASPATLAGSLVVHTAETLSAIVLAQCVRPGAPVIYGGAPVVFEMRFGTTPMSAIEATMIGAGYAQIAKYYGLPCHHYTGLSDSKQVDVQAGLETAMGAMLGAMAGINVISGAGALDFVGCQSLEKLAIDNELCGMVLRLLRGVEVTGDTLAKELIGELGPGGDYLSTGHTLNWFKKELFIPSLIIDRRERKNWEAHGARGSFEHARDTVAKILANHRPTPPAENRAHHLDEVAQEIVRRRGVEESLPLGPVK